MRIKLLLFCLGLTLSTHSFSSTTTYCTSDQKFHDSFLVTGLPTNTLLEVTLTNTDPNIGTTHVVTVPASNDDASLWFTYSHFFPALDINATYSLEVLNGTTNEISSSCAISFENSVALNASLCNQSINYHSVIDHDLSNAEADKYQRFRYNVYDALGTLLGHYEFEQGGTNAQPRFSDALDGTTTYLNIDESYTVKTLVQDQTDQWSTDEGPACSIQFSNSIKLKSNQCNSSTIDYHNVLSTNLPNSNFARYGGVRYNFYENNNGVAGSFIGHLSQDFGGTVPNYSSALTTAGGHSIFLNINESYFVRTVMKDKNGNWSNESTNTCSIAFENHIKLNSNMCGNQSIDCDQSLNVDLATSLHSRYEGFRFHFYEDLGSSSYEYVGYLQYLIGETPDKFSDPLHGACEPFLELNTDYKVLTTALDKNMIESEFNSGNDCEPVAFSTCSIPDESRCRIGASLKTDSDEAFWCSGDIELTLEAYFPSKATNAVYTCYWNGSSTAEGNTKTISAAGLVEVSGRVSYELEGTTYNCRLTPRSLEILDGSTASGKEYIPSVYWTFEGSYSATIDGTSYSSTSVNEDLIQNKELTLVSAAGSSSCSWTTSNASPSVGHYVEFKEGCQEQGKFGYEHGQTRQLSMEFLVRFADDYKDGVTPRRVDGSTSMGIVPTLRYNQFSIVANYRGYDDCVLTNKAASKVIQLTGINRKSWSYYDDDEWHHIALTADLDQGVIKLYTDGHSPQDFQLHFEAAPEDYFELGQIYNQLIGLSDNQTVFGAIDEIVFYEGQVLPPTIIAQHYENAIEDGLHYDFVDNQAFCDISYVGDIDVTGVYDDRDFPIGYDPNTDGWDASSVSNPIDQFVRAPSPRYLPDHGLRRNYPWWGYNFMGGAFGYSTLQTWPTYADEVNQELALNWYYLANALGEGNSTARPLMQAFANAHPEIPSYHTVNWATLKLANYGLPSASNKPMQTRSNLSPENYLKTSSGEQTTVWDPISAQPTIEIDGYAQYLKLESLLEGSQTPISLINENGEIAPASGVWAPEADFNHAQNSALKGEYDNNYAGTYENTDWETGYAPYLKTKLRKYYRDAFMTGSPLLSSNNTAFTYYSIDGLGGHSTDEGNWEAIREIQQNMGSNYYSTPDFYPVFVGNWDLVRAQYHGLEWINDCRRNELETPNVTPDNLFSPFVAAGWAANPINNYRPGRWLGLLKVLGVYGAEFYYTGYFTLSKGEEDPVNNARHWGWQSIAPAYAQAVTSRYETILRDGVLLEGSSTDYRLPSGSLDIYTVARKWPATSSDSEYIISTTLQPRTNQIPVNGQPELEREAVIADFPFNGQTPDLKLMSRRQGSTFLFRHAEGSTEPVLIWLDRWHEPWHFDHWDDDYVFEAEVEDELQVVTSNTSNADFISVRTRIIDGNGNEQMPSSSSTTLDFTDFISYYTFPNVLQSTTLSDWGIGEDHPKLSYAFRVSDDQSSTESYRLYVKARVKAVTGSSGTTGISVVLMDEERASMVQSDYMGCITSTDWQWYSYGICDVIEFDNLEKGHYILDLIPKNELLEIDQIILDKDDDRVFPQGETIAGACTGQNITMEADFTWQNECEGPVPITVVTMPSFNPTCPTTQTVVKYKWTNDYMTSSSSGVTPETSGTEEPETTFTNGGTYANPSIDFYYSNDLKLEVFFDNTLELTVEHDNVLGLASPSVTATTSDATICKGQEATLTATASGGTGPYTYAWFPTLNTLQSDQEVTTVLPNQVNSASDFEVTVTDANGCTATDVETLNVTAPLSVAISGGPTHCYGPNSSVSLSSSVTGGTGPYAYTWSPTTALTCNNSTCDNPTVNLTGLTGLVYKLVVEDDNGCIGKAHKLVHIEDALNAKILSDPADVSEVCATYGTILFSEDHALTTGPYSYSWNSGAATTPTYSFATTGNSGDQNFSLEVVDANGCQSTAFRLITVDAACKGSDGANADSFAPEETLQEGIITLFPNPNNGQFTVQFDELLAEESFTIEVYGLDGKHLQSVSKTDEQQVQLDLRYLASGLYFLRIHNQNSFHQLRVVVQ